MSDEHNVGTKVLRRQQQFAIRNLSAESAQTERRKETRHIAIRELTYAPIVADRSAHKLSPGTHPEVSVAPDHQVIHEQNAMRFLA
jgi:hypothetical protein